jgi:hypothetical protein
MAIFAEQGVLELWDTYELIWHSQSEHYLRALSVSEGLPESMATPEQFMRATTTAAAVAWAASDSAPGLRLALNWYQRGRAERLLSVERFTYLFLSIEALVSGVDQSPDESTTSSLEALRELATSSDLRSFVDRIGERISKPSLVDRFVRLAMALGPRQAEERIRLFRVIYKLRNRLLHGSIHEVPREFEGIDPSFEAGRIARSFLMEVTRRVWNRTADSILFEAEGDLAGRDL